MEWLGESGVCPEAGGIEAAADTAALLHRNTADPQLAGTLSWLIAKARFGKVCTFQPKFEGESRSVSAPKEKQRVR